MGDVAGPHRCSGEGLLVITLQYGVDDLNHGRNVNVDFWVRACGNFVTIIDTVIIGVGIIGSGTEIKLHIAG